MAIVDDKYIIELERLRSELVDILKNKGIKVNDNESLSTLIPKVEKIGYNDLLYNYISENLTEFKLLDETKTVLKKSYPFYPIRETVQKLYLPYVEQAVTIFGDRGPATLLEHLYIPNLRATSASYSLGYMSNLINLIAPNLVTSATNGNGMMNNNSKIVRCIIPKYVGNERLSVGLATLQLLDGNRISFANAVYNSLNILILRSKNAISLLPNITALPNENLSIYVPQEIIETYKNATNWSTYADKFKPLEGSKYGPLNWYEEEDWYKEEMKVWE